MKLLAIILSFSIFTMAVVPCADGMPENHVEHMLGTDSDAHDHTGDEDDDCTPFCACDCCSVPVTVPQVAVSESVMLAPNFSYSFLYTCNYSFDYTQGVWRPPNFSC